MGVLVFKRVPVGRRARWWTRNARAAERKYQTRRMWLEEEIFFFCFFFFCPAGWWVDCRDLGCDCTVWCFCTYTSLEKKTHCRMNNRGGFFYSWFSYSLCFLDEDDGNMATQCVVINKTWNDTTLDPLEMFQHKGAFPLWRQLFGHMWTQ